MRGITVTRRVLVAAATVGIFLPAIARAQGPEPPENPARTQAFVFERALRGAVELGGQQLAKRALVLFPEFILSTEEATVRGVKLGGYGFYFDVQVPDIQSTTIVLDMMAARQRRGGPSQPVSAMGGVTDDPMTVAAPVFDTNREYSAYVRAALIDALLDSSGVLLMSAEERLTVAVSGIERRGPNPLYRSDSGKLILTILGSDLVELRQGRITREQAKERIVEERF
jgi:hypothetical protein